MKLFRVLVLVLALAAGGVAAYLALNLSPGGPSPTVVELAPQIVSQDVLVASADIGQGQKLTATNIRWQAWPDEAVTAGYIQKQSRPDALEKLRGSVVRSHFIAGEPIRESKLALPGTGILSAILPAGKRAIAVRVSAQNTAGGFILPNDRVDVIHTIVQQGANDVQAQTSSRTILRNVRVLAIDQTIDDQAGSGTPAEGEAEAEGEAVVVGKTATLELDPPQVEQITTAESSGTLSLALRSFADIEEVAVVEPEPPPEDVEDDRLAKLDAEMRRLADELRRKPAPAPVAAAPAAAPVKQKSSAVRIFRSGRVETINPQ